MHFSFVIVTLTRILSFICAGKPSYLFFPLSPALRAIY
jgi:hypothetical protein